MTAPCPSFNLGSFLEKDKLKTNGSNFTSWFRTLRILLVPLKMSYVLETALGDAPETTATPAEKKVYLIKSDDSSLVKKGMLHAMEAELQKRFERFSAYEIITDLKTVFAPATTATPAENKVYLIKSDDSSLVKKGMLHALEAELQKRFESFSAYEITLTSSPSLPLKPRLREIKFVKFSSLQRWKSTPA